MRDDLKILAIFATGISPVMAILIAWFFGAPPHYGYSLIYRFEWANPADLLLLLLLYAPFPLWLAFLLSKLAK